MFLFKLYCALGMIFSIAFFCWGIYSDRNNGIDGHLGPFWKNGIMWFVAFTLACPLLNLVWVYLYVRDSLKA